jgi:stage II sporulation protein D
VYRGVGVEHALTDRAVEETAGLIAVFDGRPIDAMYTSTCGGHTEDAGLLFPDRAQPYLAGVPCAWERPMMLQGITGGEIFDGGSEFRQYMAVEALGLPTNDLSLQAMIDRVASLCGGVAGRIGTEPSLADFVQSLMAAGGLDETVVLVGKPGVGQLVSLADLYDVPLDSPDPARWTDGWHLRAALAVLQVQGIVTEDRGEAVPHQEGVAIYPRRAEKSEPLPETLPLYWRWNDRYGSTRAVRVLPGTTLERFRRGEDVLALVVVQSGGGGEADRRSAWRSWIRDKSWHDLAQQLEISDLERLEVTRRGPSGRVVGMVAEGRSGSRRELEGFPIRLDLGVPENLFTFHVLTSPDGNRTARFLGRGWGHGIGLCQNGAYGLARAGQTFDAILTTYYTGISIERWSGSEGTGSP